MIVTSNARVSRSISRSILVALAGLVAAACLFTTRPANAEPLGDYSIVETHTTLVAHAYLRTVSTVQVGADPLNRFFIYRVRLPFGLDHAGTMLLLPPISVGFENYEVDRDGDFDGSFAAYFAKRGYDVWGISQRVEGLAAGACGPGGADCSAMAGWDLAALADDATFARSRIALAHPGRAPVIGGLSLGSIGAIAVLNQHPHDYAGAFLMEGSMFSNDPAVHAIGQTFCDVFGQAISAGVYYDNQALPGLRALATAALDSPNGPSPVAGVTNLQLVVGTMNDPGAGPITPRPGYTLLAGDAATGQFQFADRQYALRNVAMNLDYMSLPLVHDIDCGLAGDTTYVDHLGDYDGPLFVIAADRGFGDMMLDTVDLMPDADVTLHEYPGLGHVDAYFATNHRDYTERPLLRWLHDVL